MKCSRLSPALAAILLSASLLFLASCGTEQKIAALRKGEVKAQVSLPSEEDRLPELATPEYVRRDTLKVTDLEGKEVLIMRAVKDDETGEMVATEELQAAKITARFRNVAERFGRIDLEFQIIVPSEMQDGRWQLRFQPRMYVLEDSLSLDELVVTGKDYRKAQLRGYEHYRKWLGRIITDSTKFINYRDLEIFIRRNMPMLYAFKADSSLVSEESFNSFYGVSEQKAIEHYTRKLASRRNARKAAKREQMWQRFVKAPIELEGVRLDTVISGEDGELVYNYVQTLHTRKGLRKAEIVLSGQILEQGEQKYRMPESDPLTFYISSVSTLVSDRRRYLTKVISRRATAEIKENIVFRNGKSDIDEKLSDNAIRISRVKAVLRDLFCDSDFVLDSVTISSASSPEGPEELNKRLSLLRASSASRLLDGYVKYLRDSLRREGGFQVRVGDDFSEEVSTAGMKAVPKINFCSRSGGENWLQLDAMVDADTLLDDARKASYRKLRQEIQDNDLREKQLSKETYYSYLRESLYPQIRTVRFDFALHRKGMVKDTVHTTEPDTLYDRGVQLLRDHEYAASLEILRSYQDYNTAVAYVALGYDKSALAILQECERTASVNYLMALLYSREGDDRTAVESYLRACEQDPSFVYRGNLDPEISSLIRKYDLNKDY